MHSTPAICIRRRRYSETSLIVTWVTEHAGKIKTLARGALRPRSSFAGCIDLFYQVDIIWIPSRKSDLHTLKEVALISAFRPATPAHTTIRMASYFCTLVDHMTHQDEPAATIYDLLHRALEYLMTHSPNERAILHFERELCRLLGIWNEKHTEPPHYVLAHYGGQLPSDRHALLQDLS